MQISCSAPFIAIDIATHGELKGSHTLYGVLTPSYSAKAPIGSQGARVIILLSYASSTS